MAKLLTGSARRFVLYGAPYSFFVAPAAIALLRRPGTAPLRPAGVVLLRLADTALPRPPGGTFHRLASSLVGPGIGRSSRLRQRQGPGARVGRRPAGSGDPEIRIDQLAVQVTVAGALLVPLQLPRNPKVVLCPGPSLPL